MQSFLKILTNEKAFYHFRKPLIGQYLLKISQKTHPSTYPSYPSSKISDSGGETDGGQGGTYSGTTSIFFNIQPKIGYFSRIIDKEKVFHPLPRRDFFKNPPE